MGFHFPVSLHEMTTEERSRLDENIQTLFTETKEISVKFYNKPPESTESYIDQINFLLRRYCAIIFGNIMDSKGKVSPIVKALKKNTDSVPSQCAEELSPVMRLLKDQLAPFVFSMKPMGGTTSYDRQLAKYHRIRYSRLGECFVTLIGSYLTRITLLSYDSKLSSNNLLALEQHGIIILNTLYSWIHQEIHLISDTVSYVYEKAGSTSRLETSRKANDVRHENLRKFKEKAAIVAKQMWENGSTLPHHKMVKHLIEKYVENGKHPFSFLPIKDEEGDLRSPDKVLREVVKDVAKKMNRPDLISGQKKSS